MRIEIGTKKYWVYWNYDFPTKLIKVLFDDDMEPTQIEIPTGEVITTCFIIDDNIRVKNPDGSFTGFDNQLASGTVSKFAKDRHCKATARAYSLQKAIENLFPNDLESQHKFVLQAEQSPVNFAPKTEKKGIKISKEEFSMLFPWP